MFHPSLHADESFLAAAVRAEASAHFDEADREIAAALATLEGVWADTAWESPAARAFRFALLDYLAAVLALRQTVEVCRWEVSA